MWERVHTVMGAASAPDLDAQLMLQVRDGNADSFRELLNKHRNSLIHFLYRMVQDRAVAEELAQEVFLRIYKSRESYEATAKFTTWMFRIATHLGLNWLRDEKQARGQARLDDTRGGEFPLREVTDHAPNVEQRMVGSAKAQQVRAAIAELPEKQKAAVLMHKYQEMDYLHIAGVLECSESAVKSLLFRAYETLRGKLAHMVTGGAR